MKSIFIGDWIYKLLQVLTETAIKEWFERYLFLEFSNTINNNLNLAKILEKYVWRSSFLVNLQACTNTNSKSSNYLKIFKVWEDLIFDYFIPGK